jgi:hypothetical protein
MSQFVVNWRYLLLACVVLLGAVAYLFLYLPRAYFDSLPGQDPVAFRDHYQRIEGGMTEEQVMDLLGPPDDKAEMDVSSWWFWQDKRKNGCAVWFLGDTVCSKKFWAKGESAASEWEDLPR